MRTKFLPKTSGRPHAKKKKVLSTRRSHSGGGKKGGGARGRGSVQVCREEPVRKALENRGLLLEVT